MSNIAIENKNQERFLAARQANAELLERYGFELETSRRPVTDERANQIILLGTLPWYRIPKDVMEMVRGRCLDNLEALYVLNAAYCTFQGVSARPKEFNIRPENAPWNTRRDAARERLVAAGFEPGASRADMTTGVIQPWQVRQIVLLSLSDRYDVPSECVALACEGVLKRSEAQRVIEGAANTEIASSDFPSSFVLPDKTKAQMAREGRLGHRAVE